MFRPCIICLFFSPILNFKTMNKVYALAGAALVGLLYTATATAQSAFPANTPLAITKPGDNAAARNYTIASSSNTGSATAFSAVTTFTPPVDINGIGLNPVDNKIYGAAYTGSADTAVTMLRVNLYRIGANGVMVNLGKLPTSGQSPLITTLNLNIRAEIPNYTAGTVDATGKYYYTTVGLKSTGVTKLMNAYTVYLFNPNAPSTLALDTTDIRLFVCWINNVHNLTGSNMPTTVAGYKELNFTTYPVVRAAVKNLLDSLNSGFPRNLATLEGGLQDFAIHPVNGKIYGYVSYPSGANYVGRPVVFAPTIGSAPLSIITPVGTVENTAPGVDVAGLQFNANGNFFGLFNNGTYAEINLTTGALISPVTSNLGISGSNLRGDLASPATANAVLPLNLVAFEGRLYNTYNELNWQFAPGSKITALSLERSSNSRDFEQIAAIAPQQATTYQYLDKLPPATAYYRLHMTDETGEATYSSVVKLQSGSRNNSAKAYPTILAPGATLFVEAPQADYTVSVYNSLGQLVLDQAGNMQALTSVQLPATLTPGNYWVKLTGNTTKETIGTTQITIR